MHLSLETAYTGGKLWTAKRALSPIFVRIHIKFIRNENKDGFFLNIFFMISHM